MRRRDFLLSVAAPPLASLPAVATPAARSADRFPYLDAGVETLRARMDAGRLTARTLAAGYLARIDSIDRKGPRLAAVIEVNPDALALAAERDRERKAGHVRGPLHGIPVLLKDNIATGDRMRTSAGSLALADVRASRDAFIAARLRDAGAVILGKTNLSEWANFRSTRSTSGWSARGGLTRNPYALDRSASGSSSGSAAAVAASLATLAVGTETDGSITSPASKCGIVGLKPTVGLVSRDGIVPIAASFDTAGPMTRTVADAAALLGALAGADARDAATRDALANAPADYTRFLARDGLRGARLGVVRGYVFGNDRVQALFERALTRLQAAGAELIDPVALPARGAFVEAEIEVMLHEFRAGLPAWLAEFAPAAPIRDVADLIAFNEREHAREMPHFGQELLAMAQARGGLDSAAYRDALAKARRATRDDGIDRALAEHRLDALVAPTGAPAPPIDLVNGDRPLPGFTSPAAVAGYPHITVPMGDVAGLPVGLSFVGGAWAEPTLLRLAYAFEQATRDRRPPSFARTLPAA
jgi:amidase